MATIVANPLYLADCDLLIGADDFAAEVSSVAFTPSASVATIKGAKKGAVFTATSEPTWTCDITFSQNYDADTSLSVYLFNQQGTTKTVTFRPKSGKRAVTATVTITPGAIGGAVDAFATATVTLGVVGKPTLGAVVA